MLPFYPAISARMNLVLLADDAFSFLVSWEFMSLTSWALVIAHHQHPREYACRLYLSPDGELRHADAAARFRTARRADGNYAFDAMRAAHPSGSSPRWCLILVLIGTGSKAGLVPLHAWLPLAHPAAPSHVSALMSGVMTKVAVYGFVRIVFDLWANPTGGGAWWCLASAASPR